MGALLKVPHSNTNKTILRFFIGTCTSVDDRVVKVSA